MHKEWEKQGFHQGPTAHLAPGALIQPWMYYIQNTHLRVANYYFDNPAALVHMGENM